jgi:hypothetical protein
LHVQAPQGAQKGHRFGLNEIPTPQ